MTEPFSVADSNDSSGFLFWRVSILWQRGIRNLLEPMELTHTQYVLLASLRWLDGACQADLVRHTGCDSMTTSAVARSLALQGRIDRQDDPIDRRAKLLRITAKGMALIDRAIPLVEAFDRQFFEERLGAGKGEFLQAMTVLAKAESIRG